MATWSELSTLASGSRLRCDLHKADHVISTDRARAYALDRPAIVQGSRWEQNMRQLATSSQWICHRPEIARRMRRSGLCKRFLVPSAKVADGSGSALFRITRDVRRLARALLGGQPSWPFGPNQRLREPEKGLRSSLLFSAASYVHAACVG